MKKTITTVLLAAFTMLHGTIATGGEKKEDTSKIQTTCPVMGGKINKAEYVDVKGYRIYVCCPGCKSKIQADPEKYIQQMKADGVEPEKAPVKKEHGKDAGE